MIHERFHYKSLEELTEKTRALSAPIPFSDKLSLLGAPLGPFPNRIVFQPMEGCDGTPTGECGELTLRRYDKYAAGGAGLVWFEAVAVLPEGRANPRQLWLHEKNLDHYRSVIERIKSVCARENGFEPVVIMQATHSGRYSKPEGKPVPIIAYNNPLFEGASPIEPSRVITDDGLRRVEEHYALSARLAEQAGFDGVDIKCCHRYLNSELLSAYHRPGDYGGSFENRTRLLRNGIAAARAATSKDFIVTSRFNIYDGFPYPYGFGVAHTDGSLTPDLTEPLRMVRMMADLGVTLFNVTMGNPYVNPHVNRPYDAGKYLPDEHPLEGVSRMLSLTGEIQKALPGASVVCSGLSYLREFAPFAAVGMLEGGMAALAGFGREGFAYPSFPRDVLRDGSMDKKKVCVSCSKCSELMRAGSVTGCVVRDPEPYAALYKQFCPSAPKNATKGE